MIYAIGENAARAGVIQAEKHEWLEKSVSGQEKDQQGEKLPERHRAMGRKKKFSKASAMRAEKHEWLEKSVSGQEKDQQGEKLPERHRAWRKRKTFQKSALCGWGNRG